VRSNLLIILNYSMNSTDPIFSHQLESAIELSQNFDRTVVITAKPFIKQHPGSIEVFSTGWIEGRSFLNALVFYSIFLKILVPSIFRRKVFVFSHMTEVQSALIAPLTRFLRVRHFLWYAHASKSKYLSWCHFWLTGIVTSTKGSCPISSEKVHIVGQAISLKFFNHKESELQSLTKLIHIGRFDPSKNLESILNLVDKIRLTISDITFCQVGGASNSLYAKDSKRIQEKYSECDWVTFSPNVSRVEIPEILSSSGCFIHSFSGSLDKSLLEATASKVPVVTINKEYLQIFGSWQRAEANIDLEREFLAMISIDRAALHLELERRQRIVETDHGLKQWSDKITLILLDQKIGGI
jgi:glycosyltransferase involved in cell wall biosynthesis